MPCSTICAKNVSLSEVCGGFDPGCLRPIQSHRYSRRTNGKAVAAEAANGAIAPFTSPRGNGGLIRSDKSSMFKPEGEYLRGATSASESSRLRGTRTVRSVLQEQARPSHERPTAHKCEGLAFSVACRRVRSHARPTVTFVR